MRALDPRTDLRIDMYLHFREQLRAALASFDVAVVRSFLRESGRQLGDVDLHRLAGLDDERLQTLIARMILGDPRLARAHRRARQWLRRVGAAAPLVAESYGRPNLTPWYEDRATA